MTVLRCNLVLMFLSLGLVSSCQTSPRDTAALESVVSKKDLVHAFAGKPIKLAKDRRILIIPGVGCGGCITQAQRYFVQHSEDRSIVFVFTGIDDMKIFEQEVPSHYWLQDNVVIDSLNYLMEHGFTSDYPSWLVELEDGYALQVFE